MTSRPARATGGAIAVAISVGLLILVLTRDVGLNFLNGWTIVLGGVGGVLAMSQSPNLLVVAVMSLILAMLPALIGGLGLLYLLPITLILAGTASGRARD